MDGAEVSCLLPAFGVLAMCHVLGALPMIGHCACRDTLLLQNHITEDG